MTKTVSAWRMQLEMLPKWGWVPTNGELKEPIRNQYPRFRRNGGCPVKDCNDVSGKPTKFKLCRQHYGLIPR